MTHERGEGDETPEPPHDPAEPPHDPAEAPPYPAEPYQAEALRYERERQERIDRRNAASWRIVGVVAAAALALLAYDSGRLALDARRDGRPWLYPAGVATVCVLLLLFLLAYVLRRRRRGSA